MLGTILREGERAQHTCLVHARQERQAREKYLSNWDDRRAEPGQRVNIMFKKKTVTEWPQ